MNDEKDDSVIRERRFKIGANIDIGDLFELCKKDGVHKTLVALVKCLVDMYCTCLIVVDTVCI